MDDLKWYVTLGDGTYVELDSSAYVFLATPDQIDEIDLRGEAPLDCVDDGANENNGEPMFEAHAHIYDLMVQLEYKHLP